MGAQQQKKSRSIQHRRGTAAQHTDFIGAIGEITMDTDAKTLRVHDGETPGGIALARADQVSTGTSLPDGCDFVIETVQNGNSWYRKYQSGWIEQGGDFILSTGNYDTIQLPVPMKGNYHVNIVYYDSVTNDATARPASVGGLTSTHFQAKIGPYTGTSKYIKWEVKGMVLSAE